MQCIRLSKNNKEKIFESFNEKKKKIFSIVLLQFEPFCWSYDKVPFQDLTPAQVSRRIGLNESLFEKRSWTTKKMKSSLWRVNETSMT